MRLLSSYTNRCVGKRRQIVAWFSCLPLALVLGGGPGRAGADEFSASLSGPSTPVTAGGETRIWLNVLNPAESASVWHFPEKLKGRLRGEGHAVEVELRRVIGTTPVAIAPQGFVRAEYGLRLPAGLAGEAILLIEALPGSAVVLRIQSAPTPETPTTNPSSASEADAPEKALVTRATTNFDPIDYFKRHLFPHEPFYFVAGPDSPNAKFQFSFKYQLVDDQSGLASHVGCVTNFFFGFTQTSLWDWNRESAPFEDSSYRPELMFQFNRLVRAGEDDWFHLDLQTGVMHESNGRDGANSRSLNLAYLRPKLVFGQEEDWQFALASRVWFYVGDLEDNPDLARYRGHADLRATIGTPWGVELAAFGRFGDDFDRSSLQLDLTIPLRRIRWTGFTWYFQAQYFTGYGESLLHYNERSEAWRLGFSIYR